MIPTSENWVSASCEANGWVSDLQKLKGCECKYDFVSVHAFFFFLKS